MIRACDPAAAHRRSGGPARWRHRARCTTAAKLGDVFREVTHHERCSSPTRCPSSHPPQIGGLTVAVAQGTPLPTMVPKTWPTRSLRSCDGHSSAGRAGPHQRATTQPPTEPFVPTPDVRHTDDPRPCSIRPEGRRSALGSSHGHPSDEITLQQADWRSGSAANAGAPTPMCSDVCSQSQPAPRIRGCDGIDDGRARCFAAVAA